MGMRRGGKAEGFAQKETGKAGQKEGKEKKSPDELLKIHGSKRLQTGDPAACGDIKKKGLSCGRA